MKWKQLIMEIYMRIAREYELVLTGLTIDDLNHIPSPECNSIGWLAWHLTRSQDRCNQALTEQEQTWIQGKWYLKFNRLADPTDSGFGHSSDDVASFKSPEAEVLIEYHRAVTESSKYYVQNKLTESELDRDLNNPKLSRMPVVSTRLVAVINDNLQHVGQMAYLHGMLKGKGWLGR
jgi:hypothetical protein